MTGDDQLLPEQQARRTIDEMLAAAGWVVQDYRSMNVRAGQGVAVRELPTAAGPADYVPIRRPSARVGPDRVVAR